MKYRSVPQNLDDMFYTVNLFLAESHPYDLFQSPVCIIHEIEVVWHS